MRDGVRVLVLAHMIYIAMLSISGGISGVGGEIIYYLAFLLPLFVGFYGAARLKRAREERSGVAEASLNLFKL